MSFNKPLLAGPWMCVRLILNYFDYRVSGQIGGKAAHESRMDVEYVRGQRVVVAHVVGRHQHVLAHDCGELQYRDAFVGPVRTVAGGGTVAIDAKVVGVVSAVVETK